jgi:putative transposase
MDIVKTGKKYHSGGDFIYSCQYHVIFCPKYRRKVLVEPIAKRLKELVLSKQEEYGYIVEEIEVMLDHVHMILDVNPKFGGIYRIVSKIKGYISHELRNEFPELKTKLPTLWTNSRFISSVGSVTLEVVKAYIENQKNK